MMQLLEPLNGHDVVAGKVEDAQGVHAREPVHARDLVAAQGYLPNNYCLST